MRLLAGALLIVLLGVAEARGQDLLLRDAHVVDPRTCSVDAVSIEVRGGRIAALHREPPAAAAGELVDVAGKWVVPGLIDAHVHSFGNTSPGPPEFLGPEGVARAALRAGVVAFLDLFAMEAMILPTRDRQREGALGGADIFAAGPIFTAPGGHGTEYGVPTRTVTSPGEARAQVADLAARRPDVVKLVYQPSGTMPSIDRATMAAIVDEARAQGLRTVVHIGTWEEAAEAAAAGADAITHVGRDTVPDAVVALLRERGVIVIPTMAVFVDLARIADEPSVLDDPLLAAVASPAIRSAYRDTARFSGAALRRLARAREGRATHYRSLRKLSEGGVTLVAGTDAGNIGTFQGFSLHRELEIMVEAGLSPCQALAAATTAAADFLGAPYGLDPGDTASLLVLGGSPLEDIRHTRSIEIVVHRGIVAFRRDD